MTTQPELYHDDKECKTWRSRDWSLQFEDGPEDGTICLYSLNANGTKLTDEGDWDHDEIANCPECGSNILIEFRGQLIDPWDWFDSLAVLEDSRKRIAAS